MAQAFAFDVDNGGADPFGFPREQWRRDCDQWLAMSPASAAFAFASAGMIAAMSFTAGLAAGYAAACVRRGGRVATYH